MNNGQNNNEKELVDIISMEKATDANVSDVAEAVTDSRAAVNSIAYKNQSYGIVESDNVCKPNLPEFEKSKSENDNIEIDYDISCSNDSDKDYKTTEMPIERLKAAIECILFVSTDPVCADFIAENLDIDVSLVNEAIFLLEEDLNNRSGLQLIRVAGGFQICTRPEYADYCSLVIKPALKKLSKAALETLAIIAYRQPCTIPEVEAVRGVDVSGVVKTLIERGLIKEAGKKQAPGRPTLYATTQEFLEYFGLNDLSELPDIDMVAVEEVKALESQREMYLSESMPLEKECCEAEDNINRDNN
ncbi:MAG: SMC-Scp complex subunit ScpB [Armatimonadota bacterium]